MEARYATQWRATARTYAPGDVGWGFGLATLSPDCKDGLEFRGDAKVVLTGTGAFSNSCIYRRGNTMVCTVSPGMASTADEACSDTIKIPARPDIYYYTDSPGYVSDGEAGHPHYMKPDPKDVNERIPRIFLEGDENGLSQDIARNYWIQRCPGLNSHQLHKEKCLSKGCYPWKIERGAATINAGTYESISVNGSDTVIMKGGLYCIQDTFIANGGTIKSEPYTTADGITYDGVTIVMLNNSMKITGDVEVDLKAPSTPDYPFPNLLFYAAWGNSNNQTMEGNADSAFNGTIYAPNDGSLLTIGGTQTGVKGPDYTTQIVGWSIQSKVTQPST